MGMCMTNGKKREEIKCKEGELNLIVNEMKHSPCPEEIL